MRHWRLSARMSAAVAAVGVVVLAAIVVLALAIGQLRGASDRAQAADRLVANAQAVGQLVVDGETGVRGYAITNQESFLEPLASARQAMPIATARLVDGTLGSAREDELATKISDEANAYITEYADPLVQTIRQSPARGRSVILTSEGKRRVDAIRADIRALSSLAQERADADSAEAAHHADTAVTEAILAGVLVVLLLVALVAFLARTVARPVRRVTDAAVALGGGDLTVRVPTSSGAEVGLLGSAFNDMGERLQEARGEVEAQRAELEGQNAELEHQAAELEQQTVELESQTVELEQQAAELEHGQQELAETNAALTEQARVLEATTIALREAHDRVELFARVADLLGRRESLEERAETLLESTSELVGAVVGLVYSVCPGDGFAAGDETPRLVAARGMLRNDVPQSLVAGRGLAGRAIDERRVVTASHGDGDLRLQSFGHAVTLRHELHAPLVYGDRIIGALSLARSDDVAFTQDQIAAVEHLAEQAAVAFDNAVVSAQQRRLGQINKAVLDATQDAIQMLAPDETTLLVNPAMERFRREILQVPSPDDPDFDAAEVRRSIVARVKDPEGYQQRVAAMLGDREFEGSDEFQVDDHAIHRYTAPVYTDDREFLGRIFVLRDQTDQRQLERAKDELMATVSHELRTPLAAILGFAELLMARDYDRAERNEHLGTIHQQATRLSELINDFLDLQRLELDSEGVKRTPIEFTEVLRSQIELFSAQSARHKLTLKTQGDLVVEGDEDRLRRVMANLISNAIKYSPDGGEVTVAASRRNGDVVIAVEDHGIGIPTEFRERVFERFYRVDSSETRAIGGTGLGLALVREIVRAHGGEVGVDSVEGRGSRFWITVPALHH